MKRLLIVILLFFSPAFSYDIFERTNSFEELKKALYANNTSKKTNSFEELKKTYRSDNFEDRLKLEILSNLFAEKEAKNLYNFYDILKTSYKKREEIIENVIYLPKGKYTVVVSKNRQEFKIFTNENGIIKEIYHSSCITGKREGDKFEEGDKKTPNGIYFPLRFIPPNKLSEIYGHGAFPLNYPNIIDRLIFHKTGDGIWLHATNDDNRPPFSSNGCIVVRNSVFDYISKYLSFKETPVIIVDDYSLTDFQKLQKVKKSLVEFLYKWKKSWENTAKEKDLKTYFSLYSENMVSVYGNKTNFISYKSRISRNKKWIKIFLKNIYISKDGRVLDFGNIYAVSFDMEYKSNNYNWKGKKVLYLINEGGKWKILAEESL